MKQILALILGLVLTLALLFFSFDFPIGEPEPTAAPTTAPTTATAAPTVAPTAAPTQSTGSTDGPQVPPPTEPVVYDLPTSAIILTEQAEQSRDDAGNVYFSYLYPNVRIYLENESVSANVILDLLNRIDATRSKANAVKQDVVNSGSASGFYQVQYAPQRIDGAVLSLAGTVSSFSGGAHPEAACTGVTYDLLTGNALTLDDVLTGSCTADVLCRLVVDALSANEELILYADFSLSVEDRFSGNYLSDQCWYLSNEGLCFTFEPYEVGPYASGIVTAVIPYSALPGYLEDSYFPVERISAQGQLLMTSWEEATLDRHGSMVEVNLNHNADAIVIHTDGLLYDISIMTDSLNPTVVFAADQLTPGTAIILRPGSAKLRIICTSGGQTIDTNIKLP